MDSALATRPVPRTPTPRRRLTPKEQKDAQYRAEPPCYNWRVRVVTRFNSLGKKYTTKTKPRRSRFGILVHV